MRGGFSLVFQGVYCAVVNGYLSFGFYGIGDPAFAAGELFPPGEEKGADVVALYNPF